MTQVGKSSRSPLKVITAIVAVIVVAIFVAATYQIRETSQGRTVSYDSRDYLYEAEAGRFGDLYETAVQDMDKHTTYSTEVAECRALAFYYEQAVLEHAYRTTGDNAKADACVQRMKEYEFELGSMSSKAADARKAASG